MEKKPAFWMMLVLITTLSPLHAQKADIKNPAVESLVLVVENQNSHKQFFLSQGQSFRFRRTRSTDFERARLTVITDSSISFLRQKKTETLAFTELAAIRLPASDAREITGTILAATGALCLISGMVGILSKDELENVTGGLSIMTGLILFPAGMALRGGKKVRLNTRWKLHAIKNSEI